MHCCGASSLAPRTLRSSQGHCSAQDDNFTTESSIRLEFKDQSAQAMQHEGRELPSMSIERCKRSLFIETKPGKGLRPQHHAPEVPCTVDIFGDYGGFDVRD